MGNNRSWIVLLLSCIPIQLCGAAESGQTSSESPSEATEEVVVQGARLRELRDAIIDAEKRFYARYNDLNKVDKFDVECVEDAHTGARLKRRRCFTRLQLDSRSLNGVETLEMRQAQDGPTPHPGRPPNTNPEGVWLAHYDEYRDNMLYLLKVNPDLRRLAAAGEAAQKRYDKEYKRRMKGRVVLIE